MDREWMEKLAFLTVIVGGHIAVIAALPLCLSERDGFAAASVLVGGLAMAVGLLVLMLRVEQAVGGDARQATFLPSLSLLDDLGWEASRPSFAPRRFARAAMMLVVVPVIGSVALAFFVVSTCNTMRPLLPEGRWLEGMRASLSARLQAGREVA